MKPNLHDTLSALESKVLKLETEFGQQYELEFSLTQTWDRLGDRTPDDILTVGLIGGTGVGKSSIINALAGGEVSESSARRPTTARAIAYVHEDRVAALAGLKKTKPHLSDQPGLHKIEAIRSLILLDLPDIDSRIESHAAAVNEIIDELDIVVWVTSVTKYGDRIFHDWLHRYTIDRDNNNFYFVLNKIDEVDESQAQLSQEKALAELRKIFVAGLKTSCGESFQIDEGQIFLTQTLDPKSRLGDLEGLKSELFRERDSLELARIKSSNRLQFLDSRMDAMERELEWPTRVRALRDEVEIQIVECRQAIAQEEVFAEIKDSLLDGMFLDRACARRFDAELATWPLLGRLKFLLFPIRQVTSLFGRLQRFLLVQEDGLDEQPGAIWPQLCEHLNQISWDRRRRVSEQADRFADFAANPVESKQLNAWIRKLQGQASHFLKSENLGLDLNLESQSKVRQGTKALIVWGPLLWFPLLQPLLQEVLEPKHGLASLGLRLVYRLVKITGAVHLLMSLLFVALVYLTCLVWIRTRALFQTRRAYGKMIDSESFTQFLSESIEDQFAQLDKDRLSQLESEQEALATLRASLVQIRREILESSPT